MNSKRILIVDTQIAGHHVLWLFLTAKVMLERNYRVVLVVNHDLVAVKQRIDQIDANIYKKLVIIPARLDNKTPLNDYFDFISKLLVEQNCQHVLFNNFDTIASKLFRSVALGYRPPHELFGKVSIIYHRPRPLDDSQYSLGETWKRFGLYKLIKDSFFANIFLLDPFIVEKISAKLASLVHIVFIPDPWIEVSEQSEMPPEFDLTDTNLKVLQYGVGDKRKGTKLLLTAYNRISKKLPITLVIAGSQNSFTISKQVIDSPQKIILIDRFVNNAEEKFLFEACDVIAIPYLSHYGSSNILSKAAQYCKPVLASDFHLIGHVVAKKNLGVLFRNQNVNDLTNCLLEMPTKQFNNYFVNLIDYSRTCSFSTFANALSCI